MRNRVGDYCVGGVSWSLEMIPAGQISQNSLAVHLLYLLLFSPVETSSVCWLGLSQYWPSRKQIIFTNFFSIWFRQFCTKCCAIFFFFPLSLTLIVTSLWYLSGLFIWVYQGCFWHCIRHDKCRLLWQAFDINQGYTSELIKAVSDCLFLLLSSLPNTTLSLVPFHILFCLPSLSHSFIAPSSFSIGYHFFSRFPFMSSLIFYSLPLSPNLNKHNSYDHYDWKCLN